MSLGLGTKVDKTRMMNDARSRHVAAYAFNEEGKIKMNRVPTMKKAVDGRDDISKLLIKDDLQEKKTRYSRCEFTRCIDTYIYTCVNNRVCVVTLLLSIFKSQDLVDVFL